MTEKERRAKQRIIIESLKNGSTRAAACKAAGINRATFYNWFNASRKFRKRVEEALLTQIGVVEDALYKAAVEGSVAAQKFFLCNRAPDRWKDRVEQYLTGDERYPVRLILTDERDKASSVPEQGNKEH